MPMNKIKLSVLSLSLVAAFPALADSSEAARLKALEQKLNQSLAVIEQLQKRITDLEQVKPAPAVAAVPVAPAPAAAPAAAPAEVAARIDSLEQAVSGLTSGASRSQADSGVPLHGFLDVGYARSSRTVADQYGRTGFRVGTFDLYLTPQLSDRVKALLEIAYEYDYTGTLGVDMERAQLGYTVNDNLTAWAGRFHTPYGYWNTAFHHGAQIQTSITRPRVIAFEDGGGLLPAHTVGAWATGKVATGAGRLNYDFYAGNSQTLRSGVLDYNAVGKDTGGSNVGFNVGLSPQAVPGLTLGLHGLSEKVVSNGTNQAGAALNGQIGVRMLGGYGFYETDDWEVIGEYYRFSNKDLAGSAGTNSSWAGFVQAGYHLSDRWTGYARYEKASLSANDPYFKLMNNGITNYGASYDQKTIGVRYDLDQRSALKFQAERINDAGNPTRVNTWLRAQYAVRF